MHVATYFASALLAASGASALRSAKVKLSDIQSLTLRKDLKTSHRRVSAIPQLRCIGGSAKGLYDIDVMRCKNAGSDYDESNIQWTCTASLPEEFKLGSTDVICEGYDYPEDPYILKGSCGVEYRLILTDKGHKKFGKGRGHWGGDDEDYDHEGPKTFGAQIAGAIFWLAFVGVACWILYSAFIARQQGPDGAGVAGGNRPGWGGGGGGWGGPDNDDDPPPPYYDGPPPSNKRGYGGTDQQQWRPGFWSGALGGAAAGWAAGRMGNNGNSSNTGSGWGNRGGSSWDNGEGSSRSSSGSSFSGSRHESTGFGSTSRR